MRDGGNFRQNLMKLKHNIMHATILHYLVVSFLTGATELEFIDFLQIYQDSKRAGLLKYIRPASIKALPRSLILRYFPKMFYRIYHH